MDAQALQLNGALVEGNSTEGVTGQHDEMLARVGHMTRSLHESLRELGFDILIEKSTHDIPNARDRLDYVARMTEQAAQRVLNATDEAGPLQGKIESLKIMYETLAR